MHQRSSAMILIKISGEIKIWFSVIRIITMPKAGLYNFPNNTTSCITFVTSRGVTRTILQETRFRCMLCCTLLHILLSRNRVFSFFVDSRETLARGLVMFRILYPCTVILKRLSLHFPRTIVAISREFMFLFWNCDIALQLQPMNTEA